MRQIVSPLDGFGSPFGRRASSGFTFYVDSVSGSDSNDGLTADTAFQTLATAQAAVIAEGAGTSLGLARGSSWREKLDFGAVNNIRVGVYGTGDAPIINAADVATGWTQPDAATYPNVWYLPNWISECINTNFLLTAFENGLEMTNVASLATLNTTAGASFITTSPDGDDAVYIHATGSGNPNTNGSTYEVSKRDGCIRSDTVSNSGLTIEGPLDLRNSPWNSGHMVSALNASFKKAVIKDGVRGTFMASGTVQDVIVRGSSKRRTSGTSNMTVFYMSSANPGTYAGSVKRVGYLKGDAPDGAGGTYEDVSGLFSHNDQAGVTHNCTSEQCWFVGIAGLGGFRGGTHEHVAPYTKNAGSFNLQAGTSPVAVPVRYGLFNGGIATTQLSSWDAVHDFQHCVSYDAKNLRTGDGFNVQNCVWYKNAAGQNALTTPISGGVPNLAVNNSIIITNGWNYAIDMIALTSYTGDYNIFASFFTGRQARFRYNSLTNDTAGATQYKLKWWQDNTGQDANSVYILPADQTIGGANALFLGWAEASSGALTDHGPAQGDFRINPSARVYSGLDVAYIGEFPDGTPLVANVGPQFHWDWNARAVASGPPTSWPTVPESTSEAETYVANPTAWDFYP